MNVTELLLIDLSSLAYPIYKMSGNEPDPDWTSTQIVSRVRALASNHAHAAICCDSGKSFRHDLSPRRALGDGKYEGYKANRSEKEEPYLHQVRLACEVLKADGFPIWSAGGYEADDIIATATAEALKCDPDTSVLIASSDKDLAQLVSDRVRIKSLTKESNGLIRGPQEIEEKFLVKPSQMNDWLCLVGDESDNIKGAKGIGIKIASDLLKRHGSLERVYAEIDKGVVPGIPVGLRTNLQEFRDRWPLTKYLVSLTTDVPIPFAEIAVERTAPPMEEPLHTEDEMREILPSIEHGNVHRNFETPADNPLPPSVEQPLNDRAAVDALRQATAKVAERIKDTQQHVSLPSPEELRVTALGRGSLGLVPISATPVDFEQQLEPRNIEEAWKIAQYSFRSKLFSAFGSAEAVLMVIMAGRELGMSAMASLRGFHLVEGRPTLSADLIRALIIRSGKAKYFRPVERTDTRATWETQRGDDPPVSLTFTIEEARQAGVVRPNSGWVKYPTDMLTARASAKLARLIYADIVFNLFDPSEFDGS